MEAKDVADLHHATRGAGRRLQQARFGNRPGERLLHEAVTAGLQGGARHRVVTVRGGDDVEPPIVVDVDELHVAVVGRVQETRYRGGAGVGEDAGDVEQQDVAAAAGNRPRLLANDDEVDVAVEVDVAPGVVLLRGVGQPDRRVGGERMALSSRLAGAAGRRYN